jgi:hypothetical protein
LSDLRFWEGHLDVVERAFREQKEKEEEAADTTTAEIKKWLKYAASYSQKSGVAMNAEKPQAEMEKNVLQSISAQTTFYQYLFSRNVDCIVEGAQKRSKCRVSGSVTSLKVETDNQRMTYEYVIIEQCPERTYRQPAWGGQHSNNWKNGLRILAAENRTAGLLFAQGQNLKIWPGQGCPLREYSQPLSSWPPAAAAVSRRDHRRR